MEKILKQRREELKDVYNTINEWIQEFPEDFKKSRRREYLIPQIKWAKKQFFKACKELAEKETELTYWSEVRAKKLEKKLQGLNREVKIYTGSEKDIENSKIELAKNFQITELVEHKKYMAICPFHNEKTPSMYLKKNFYHCFGCGANGDVIDFVMKTQNLSFKQAVEYLT